MAADKAIRASRVTLDDEVSRVSALEDLDPPPCLGAAFHAWVLSIDEGKVNVSTEPCGCPRHPWAEYGAVGNRCLARWPFRVAVDELARAAT